MSTTKTFDAGDLAGEDSSSGSLFDRAFRRFTAAREARAQAIVQSHLARLSDNCLVELGYEPNDIRRIRAASIQTMPYWI